MQKILANIPLPNLEISNTVECLGIVRRRKCPEREYLQQSKLKFSAN